MAIRRREKSRQHHPLQPRGHKIDALDVRRPPPWRPWIKQDAGQAGENPLATAAPQMRDVEPSVAYSASFSDLAESMR